MKDQPFDIRINSEVFEISSAEVYNKCIPKYYTEKHRGDPPMVNGIRVTWEEYIESHPDFTPDEEFVPEMVYAPEDDNQARSMETVAAMIDYLDNNMSFSLFNPGVNYPIIIEILEGYIEMVKGRLSYDQNEALQRYLPKVENALTIMRDAYFQYQARLHYRATGQRMDNLTEFDRIEKRFM